MLDDFECRDQRAAGDLAREFLEEELRGLA
jgi:hypothetical protein